MESKADNDSCEKLIKAYKIFKIKLEELLPTVKDPYKLFNIIANSLLMQFTLTHLTVQDEDEAFEMLESLSGKTHEVISSVCIKTNASQKTVHAITKVTFKTLSAAEIWHYIKNYSPMDKAGAYGIQEWFGFIAVTKIEGSYFNVMGLPVHLVYQALEEIVN